MANVDPALWRAILDFLRLHHGPICRQWFEELEPVALDSGLLQIHAPNAVQQNYLQKRCLDQFTEAAQSASGALLAVRFVTGAVERPAPPPLRLRDAPPPPTGHDDGQSSTGRVSPPAQEAPDGVFPKPPPQWEAPSPESVFEDAVISPDHSFENFVTGPGNQLAFAASVAVANQPGTAYNPLFIHGGVGLGKTHLLQAICQTLLKRDPSLRLLYLSCDAFMNQFLECVQSGKMNEFRHRYRHVDLLVIDDIHFLANRERTQEEFFHTFNELYQANKQIVLSSDSPPAEIPQLEERLVSRFNWGMVANVSKPCYETRVAIIKAKVRLRGLQMPEDVISYIATRIESNARELEGAITTIQGHASLQGRVIDLTLAQAALGDTALHAGVAQITLQNIINAVTAFYNVKLSDLQSKRRHKSITGPRQVCMYLARRRTRFSLEEIGGYFGGRDHTTVMHSIRMVEERMGADPAFAMQIEKLDQQIAKNNTALAG